MITRLQPTISPTGIRYILDNEGRQIATVSSLLDGIDNKARAKESEYIHNAICDSFNELAALRAERDNLASANAELREALENLNYLAVGAIEEGMTAVEIAETVENMTLTALGHK